MIGHRIFSAIHAKLAIVRYTILRKSSEVLFRTGKKCGADFQDFRDLIVESTAETKMTKISQILNLCHLLLFVSFLGQREGKALAKVG